MVWKLSLGLDQKQRSRSMTVTRKVEEQKRSQPYGLVTPSSILLESAGNLGMRRPESFKTHSSEYMVLQRPLHPHQTRSSPTG